jgi:ABC-type antimicrobial peptide transport system permease subunit
VIERNTSERHNGNRLSTKIPSTVYSKLASSPQDSIIVSRLSILNGLTVRGDGRNVYKEKIHSADAAITDIFSFDVLDGSLLYFGIRKEQAILSRSIAQLLFGTTHLRGKEISVCTQDDTLQFEVAAVYEDFPRNAHEEFNIFILFDPATIETLGFSSRKGGVYGRTIHGKTDLERKLQAQASGKDLVYFLQPLPDIYFGPRVLGEDAKHGDSYSILILVCLTGLILFLALASYVNLTSLTLPYRSKELAIRKLAGTNQWQLFVTFFKESFAIVGVSFLAGVAILLLTADLIEPILSVDLSALILTGDLTLYAVVSGILLCLMLGPLVLTLKFIRATPTRLLSAEKITFPHFKRTITVLQLGISIFLIVSSTVIKRQINYSLLKEPGRNYDQVVYLAYPDDLTKEGLSRLRSGWQMYHPNIVDLIALSQLPDRISSKELNSPFYSVSVDPFYPGFFQLNMIVGNWFRPNAADSVLVLNERGRHYITAEESRNVIGIVEDINSQFNLPQKPTKFRVDETFTYNYLCVRVLEVDIRRTIQFLSSTFDGAPVHILNKRFEDWLQYQDRLNYLSNLLGIISVLLSCCAIYGLSVSLVRDKLKQIAVHKICGADTHNIAFLLAREFVRETFIAVIIFAPVTYIFLNELLRNFVYSTDFQWMDPIFPLAYCMLITMVLCGFQALTLNRKDLSSALKN